MRFRTTLLLAGKTANRSTVAVMGGVFMVGVSADNRAAAIAGDEAAQRFWDGLSYSRKSRFVLSVEGAKTAETRQRRIDKSVTDLRDGKA